MWRGEHIEPKTKWGGGGDGGGGQSVVGGEVGGGGADKGLMEEGEGRGARVGAPLKVARYGMEGKVSSHISPLLL